MAKKKVTIHASMITPYNQKPSSNDLLLRPCSQIVKTKGLKMVRSCTSKSSNQTKKRKGVLGIIESPVVSIDGKITISFLEAASVAQIITGSRKLKGDLVLIIPSNKVRPTHLPDLYDMALVLKAVKYFVRWVISTHGGKEGCGAEHVLPNFVMTMVDPPSEIPAVVECCNFSTGDHHLKIPSYRNDFKYFTIPFPMFVSKISTQSTTTSLTILDGREIVVNIQVLSNEHVGFWNGIGEKGLRCLVWNCRHLARETFLPSMRSAIEMHMPHFIILTETRVSIHMARLIYAYLKPFAVYGISQTESEDGFAILTFSKHMKMKLISSFPNDHCWALDVQ